MMVAGQHGLPLWAEPRETAAAGAEAVVLIPGLGMQAVEWPEELLAVLAARFRTVVFDNRDVGLSGRCGPEQDPSLGESDFPDWAPPSLAPAYRLFDMAEDVVALLDGLGIRAAHIVGYSMGGMIGQILAARFPQRVLTLTSLMSSGGEPWIRMTPAVQAAFARSIVALDDSQRRIDNLVEEMRVFLSPGLAFDPVEARRSADMLLARAYSPAGIWRQARAMRGSGDRTALLGEIRCPTLVVHGACDPCIDIEQGRNAGRLIPNASFVPLAGIGHDLSAPAIAQLAALLPAHMLGGRPGN